MAVWPITSLVFSFCNGIPALFDVDATGVLLLLSWLVLNGCANTGGVIFGVSLSELLHKSS